MTNPKSPYRYGATAVTTKHNESGVALIIAIVALLLVTAVAAGMILVSTSETKVDANYRDRQVALYAAKAGLEEARDRMLTSNANKIALPTVLPSAGAGSIANYILQTGIAPWTNGSLVYGVSTYDSEFANEINGTSTLPSGASYSSYSSISNYSGPTANPIPYQWVRINLKTDRSAYTKGTPYYVDGNSGNAAAQVFYDPITQTECVAGATSLTSPCNSLNPDYSSIGPVYEITSFAVTPNGATAMVQDEVAAYSFNLSFPSALTLAGNVPAPPLGFKGATSNPYQVSGVNGSGGENPPGCTPSSSVTVPAIGATSATSVTNIENGIPSNRTTHYTGSCSSTPCVNTVSMPTTDSTPTQLNQTLQSIEQSASVSLVPANPPGSYSYSDVTAAMGGSWNNSSDNPQVIYVDGDFDLGPNTGSGILVVTGNFTYEGNSGWNGIIMVVGEGTTTFIGNGGGNGQFNGAVMVATTDDANGNPLSSFGTINFDISGGGGNGIYYNSCWINTVQQPVTYKLLSSKQISN